MGRLRVCPMCLQHSEPDDGYECCLECGCRVDTITVDVQVVLSPSALAALDAARWEQWLYMWDECERIRGEKEADPYLDPRLDWTADGRVNRWMVRHAHDNPKQTVALLNAAIKSVYTDHMKLQQQFQRQAYGQANDPANPPESPLDPESFTEQLRARCPAAPEDHNNGGSIEVISPGDGKTLAAVVDWKGDAEA